jgi:hypothetical protein
MEAWLALYMTTAPDRRGSIPDSQAARDLHDTASENLDEFLHGLMTRLHNVHDEDEGEAHHGFTGPGRGGATSGAEEDFEEDNFDEDLREDAANALDGHGGEVYELEDDDDDDSWDESDFFEEEGGGLSGQDTMEQALLPSLINIPNYRSMGPKTDALHAIDTIPWGPVPDPLQALAIVRPSDFVSDLLEDDSADLSDDDDDESLTMLGDVDYDHEEDEYVTASYGPSEAPGSREPPPRRGAENDFVAVQYIVDAEPDLGSGGHGLKIDDLTSRCAERVPGQGIMRFHAGVFKAPRQSVDLTWKGLLEEVVDLLRKRRAVLDEEDEGTQE